MDNEQKLTKLELLGFDNVDYGLIVSVVENKEAEENDYAQIINSGYKDMFFTEVKNMKEKASPSTTVDHICFKKLGGADVLYSKMTV